MAKKNGYTVTRSNFVIKEHHLDIPEGTVYERDFTTIKNLGGWNGGTVPYGDNGFKLVYRDNYNDVRKHSFGEYLKHDNGNDVWTLSNGAAESLTSESKIVLKTNNTSLLNYVYFGNCTELIKSSVTDIISKFPAEAYSLEENVGQIEGKTAYLLNNAYGIDMVTERNDGNIEIDNPLRYFFLSANQYVVYDGETDCGCINFWHVEKGNPCDETPYDYRITILSASGLTATVWQMHSGTNKFFVVDTPNVKIRPMDAAVEEFFNNIDDFERLLLNRDTEPLYTAYLDYPHETENGIETYIKSFTWPVDNGWNLDISSLKYEYYINDLLKLADFCDEHYTDNLWRMMVHDSIKNMDLTFSRPGKDEDTEDYNEGTTRLQGLLWAYGRFFDELKRSTDNISSVNRIQYSGEGNTPDYFLSDSLNLSGWEVSSAVDGIDKDATVSNLFEGYSKEYGRNDANVRFLTNLKLNSRNIFLRKGTRYGIEMLLGMFGYRSDDFMGSGNGDYSMDEFINIAEVKKSGETITHCSGDERLTAEDLNRYKVDGETDTPDGKTADFLDGLPVRLFYYERQDGTIWKTIIPWFKNVEELDGHPYFQMYGGWGGNGEDDEYLETINYLRVVKNTADLTKFTKDSLYGGKYGDIVYVVDDEDYYVLPEGGDVETIGEGGWVPVESGSTNTRVVYLNSIIDEYRGNNPHVGYGKYDNGEEYLNYYRKIFKNAIETENFSDALYDCETGELNPIVESQGFDLYEIKDNKKCWYYYDKDIYRVSTESLKEVNDTGIGNLNFSGSDMNYVDCINVSGVTPVDVRDDSARTEDGNTIYAEPSVVNVKKLIITFRTTSSDEENFIDKSVVPYMLQVVPSTTILEIKKQRKD